MAYGDMNQGGYQPPVNVGDEIEVSIEGVGEKGDGIAKKEGFVIFVPGVQQGDHVKIKVTRVLKKVGFADVLEKLEAPAAPEPEQQETSLPEPEPEAPAEDSEDFGDEPEEEENKE